MNYQTYSERLKYILEMIEKDKLPGPASVANKFNCSEKTIRRMVNHLRSDGHNIKYCKNNKKYFLRN